MTMIEKEQFQEVDQTVGQRIRMRRAMLGISQQELSKKLQISFQQLQKYEKGANRVSAGKLFYIAKLLKVDIGYFYPDSNKDDYQEMLEADNVSLREQKQLLELMNNFSKIKDPKIKSMINKFVKTSAE